MTAWERFVTSVKHTCFYSHWLQRGGSGISWKRGGCVPKQEPTASLEDPRYHPGEFLYKWPHPNTWARLKRSFSTDCFSLTANELKAVACELCRSRRGGGAELGEMLWSAGVRGLCPHCRIPLSQILSAETVSQQIFNNTNNFPVLSNNVFWGGESTFCKYPVFCTEKNTPLKTVCWV